MNKITELLGIKLPIIQAPMAGSDSIDLALAVSEAGGLGSLACALLNVEEVRTLYGTFQQKTKAPLNLNFFCHKPPLPDPETEARWKALLEPFYKELGIDLKKIQPTHSRMPFDDSFCHLIEELKPKIVSFHFGLPESSLLSRVKKLGAKILSSATSVEEAVWLERQGCDAIIAQGAEAGGHRGAFLNLNPAQQVGTFALVPQIVDAVRVPVIAAGGISDGRGIAAAFTLGADAVQVGTAYLFCPEAKVSPIYRKNLKDAQAHETVLTNIFSGRPARGILNRLVESLGPLSSSAPPFPLASIPILPLRAKSDAIQSRDFLQMWAGQATKLCRELPAKELTLKLFADAEARLKQNLKRELQ